HSSAGWTLVSGGVAVVGNQGVDKNGRAMVDFVTTGGQGYEYRDGTGLVSLGGGVRDAEAGLGVSYVLLTNGNLLEFSDNNNPSQPGQWSTVTGGVASLDAGTD